MSMPSDPRVYEGRLSDGRTAAAMRVEVRIAEQGLEILPAGERRAPLVWPYRNLRSSVPLRSDAPDVLLSLTPGSSQTLFVADPAFALSLRPRVGSLTPAWQRLMGMRAGLVFAALVAAIVGFVWYMDYRPTQAMARMMPQTMREDLGRKVVASLTGGMKQCETVPGRAALDRLTQRLVMATSEVPPTIQVTVIDWNLINAFAAPGGRLVLTRGLLESAGSPEEVAGVLAHELGHALELHPEAGLIRAVGLGLAADLIFAGSGTATNIGLILTQLSYTREAEREADAHAIRILKTAGISPKGFGDFFERIEATYGSGSRVEKGDEKKEKKQGVGARLLTILSTHPLTPERVALVRKQAPYPTTPALSDADWRALRGICAGTTVLPPPQRQALPPPQRQPPPPTGDSGGQSRGSYR